MKVILITDNDINEVIAVYTLRKFIQEANKEYFEANWDSTETHFNLDTLDLAIDWYVETSCNLAISIMEVETSLDDEV